MLEGSYIQAQLYLYRLNIIIKDPRKFAAMKLNMAYEDIAEKITGLRSQTGFAADLLKYSRTMNNPTLGGENVSEIIKSLQQAFNMDDEFPFYTKHMRVSEIKTIIEYKKNQKQGQI